MELKKECDNKKREGLNLLKDKYNKLCQQVNVDAKAFIQILKK